MDADNLLNLQKEQFSFAYIRAVASVAGFFTYKPESDINGVDLIIARKGGGDTYKSPMLGISAKCTSQDIITNNDVKFEMEVLHYNYLRERSLVPKILVVVHVPKETDKWISQTETSLSMYNCGYWLSLRDSPATENPKNIVVPIPRSNKFSVTNLREIMTKIGSSGVV